MGDQGGRKLQNLAFRAREAFPDLFQDLFGQGPLIGVGNADQAAFVDAAFAKACKDRFHGGFPGPAHSLEGNTLPVFGLRQDRQKVKGASDAGGQMGDPAAFSQITEVRGDHIGDGGAGQGGDLPDDLLCGFSLVPEPRRRSGHVAQRARQSSGIDHVDGVPVLQRVSHSHGGPVFAGEPVRDCQHDRLLPGIIQQIHDISDGGLRRRGDLLPAQKLYIFVGADVDIIPQDASLDGDGDRQDIDPKLRTFLYVERRSCVRNDLHGMYPFRCSG